MKLTILQVTLSLSILFGDTYYGTMRPSAYNPDLKWETTTTYNAGFRFGLSE